MGKIRIISIHGTFARDADWVRPGSSFQKAILERVGNDIVFEEPLIWSGRNSIKHRKRAADRFSRRLLASKSDHPNDTWVAIGHSHGGSVIAYALKSEPALSNSLAGAAFLATPFIDIRPQNAWQHTVRTLWAGSAVVLWIVLTVALIGPVLEMEVWDAYGNDVAAVAVALVSMVFGLGLFRVVPLVSERLIALLKPRLDRLCGSVSTSLLPSGPNFAFIRSPGDEAAGVLSVMQMLAWPFMRLQARLSAVFSAATGSAAKLWRWGWIGRSILIATALFIAQGFVVSAVFYAIDQVFGSQSIWSSIILAPFDDSLEFDIGDVPLWAQRARDVAVIILRVAMVVSLVIGAVIGAAFAMFLAVVVLVSVSCMAFGASLWSVGPFVELAVEPLPRGKWPLNRLGWDPQGTIGLSHSSPYSSPEGVRALTEWLAALHCG